MWSTFEVITLGYRFAPWWFALACVHDAVQLPALAGLSHFCCGLARLGRTPGFGHRTQGAFPLQQTCLPAAASGWQQWQMSYFSGLRTFANTSLQGGNSADEFIP